MRFNVFRRCDEAVVVVPVLFRTPLALQAESDLRWVGSAYVELAMLSEPLIEQIGLNGYAVAQGLVDALLRGATQRDGVRGGAGVGQRRAGLSAAA